MNKKNVKTVIASIGDELIADVIDSNGPQIAARLRNTGINVINRIVLPDNAAILVEELTRLCRTNDIIICCGGLGPTQDDLTREVIAKVLDLSLVKDIPALQAMQRRYQRMKFRMSVSDEKQVLKPKGATILSNRCGSAPGFVICHGGVVIAALPGPPTECIDMLNNALLPFLEKKISGNRHHSIRKELSVCGISESALQEKIGPVVGKYAVILPGFLIQEPGEVLIKLSIDGKKTENKNQIMSAVVKEIKQEIGEAIVSENGESLPEVIGKMLKKKKQTMAVAESCTGGMISHRITMIPGSSKYFMEGIVTYSNEAKSRYLEVSSQQLKKYGAVSQEVAIQMAKGLRKRSGATWTLSVTGIAGPGGGSMEKPVGTVHVGIAGPNGCSTHHQLKLSGSRFRIQNLTATLALDMLRKAIIKG